MSPLSFPRISGIFTYISLYKAPNCQKSPALPTELRQHIVRRRFRRLTFYHLLISVCGCQAPLSMKMTAFRSHSIVPGKAVMPVIFSGNRSLFSNPDSHISSRILSLVSESGQRCFAFACITMRILVAFNRLDVRHVRFTSSVEIRQPKAYPIGLSLIVLSMCDEMSNGNSICAISTHFYCDIRSPRIRSRVSPAR